MHLAESAATGSRFTGWGPKCDAAGHPAVVLPTGGSSTASTSGDRVSPSRVGD